jgi:GntR family transcriptional regulator
MRCAAIPVMVNIAPPSNPLVPTRAEGGDAPAFSPLYQQIKTLITRSLRAGE